MEMFKKYAFIFVLCVCCLLACQNEGDQKADSEVLAFENSEDKPPFQEGDIIFQTSLSAQSKAIQLATNSIYSHCGIIYKQEDKFFVFEAIQPITSTPLKDWIARGEGQTYVVKRLKSADELLTDKKIQEIKSFAVKWQGINYDSFFEWSDDKLYCSELIWKIYKRGLKIELGQLQKLKDFDLSSKVVQSKLQERYGTTIPYEELVVSPASIFESEHLETVSQD